MSINLGGEKNEENPECMFVTGIVLEPVRL